jgi:Na+-transporting NADH:ubiquinone oxidoreductase subunit C
MKGGYLYTLIFMLILCVVLTAALALANAYFQPVIRGNADLAVKKAVLDAFGLDVTGTPAEIEQLFSQRVKPTTAANNLPIFVRNDAAGQIDGIAVPFSGPGLWGTIRGYLAVTRDQRTVLGLVFTSQNETPGLGGRIEEPAFRDQFRGLAIGTEGPLAYGSGNGSGIDAIAGATATSRSVLKILNQLIEQVLPDLGVSR